MSKRCQVQCCSKWAFEGGLCREHMLAPQAAGPASAAAAAASPFPKQPASLPPVLALPGVEHIGGAKGGSTAPGTLQSIVARMTQHLRECSRSNEHRPSGITSCGSVGARNDVPSAEANTYLWSNWWSCTCAGALSRFCSLVPIPLALLTYPSKRNLKPPTPRDCLCTGGWECSNCKSSWPYTLSQCEGAMFSPAVCCFAFTTSSQPLGRSTVKWTKGYSSIARPQAPQLLLTDGLGQLHAEWHLTIV
jgi:hypothetical protein